MIMKDNFRRLFTNSEFSEWYYTLVILGYIATVFVSAMRPGVFATGLIILVIAELIIKKKMNIHSVMDVLIVVYFIYNALSVIWLTKGGMPVNIYTGEFAVSLLPVVFYFVGSRIADKADNFYKKFLLALAVLGIVSLILYAFAPQFYCDYLVKWSYMSKADAATCRVRMQSVTGCTVFGALMVMGMCAGVHFVGVVGEDKESKNKRIFGVCAVVFSMFFAFMSNQRACMVAAIIVLIYINYLIFARFDNIPKKYLAIEIVGLVVVFVAICIIRYDFALKIWFRLASLPTAVSERSEQWVAAVNNMYSSWFGNGLGANGHKALGIEGAHVIADGGLIKMYCEQGVLGFSLFVYIIFLTIKKSLGNIGKLYAEFGFIIVALLLSIGSNILAFQLTTPIFWFAIGRCWVKLNEDEKLRSILSKKEKAS